MGKNTNLGGQQSFFIKKKEDGNYDLVITTYKDGNNTFALGAFRHIDEEPLTVTEDSNGTASLDNDGGEIVENSFPIVEFKVALTDLSSSNGMLKGTTGDSGTPIEFSVARMVYIKYVAGTDGSLGYVVIGVVDPWSY